MFSVGLRGISRLSKSYGVLFPSLNMPVALLIEASVRFGNEVNAIIWEKYFIVLIIAACVVVY